MLGLCSDHFSTKLRALYKSPPFPLPAEMFKSEGFRTFLATILAHNFLWKCFSDTLQAQKALHECNSKLAGIVFRDIQPKLFNWLPRETGPPTGLSGQMKEINTEI